MSELKLKKEKMTGWYDPGQFAITGIQVAISTIFGKNADRRILQSFTKSGSTPEKPFYDASKTGGDFWFDYISDVGDGFNSTMTMAYYVTKSLSLKKRITGQDRDPVPHDTETGQMLVFGGDEVYPIAARENYSNKLFGPYNAAFPKPKDPNPEAPLVFSVPGNHDWYDSLVEFSFHFMEDHFGKVRHFCGWRTVQERSYFAVKLPAGWWLFGTDMQLGSALDGPQMKYFKNVVDNHMCKDDRIILCNAEPSWITHAMYPDNPDYENRNIGFFEGHILRPPKGQKESRIAIHVAGDRHYYRHHEEIRDPAEVNPECPDKRHKFVAGGGGAFLHPTHNEGPKKADVPADQKEGAKKELDKKRVGVNIIGSRPPFELKASFPEESESAAMNKQNLIFVKNNPKFGLLIAAAYLLTAHAFMSDFGKYGLGEFHLALHTLAVDTLTRPFSAFWVVAIIGGFILFTDTASKWYKRIAGAIHGIVHLTAVLLISYTAARIVNCFSPLNLESIWQLVVIGIIISVLGFLIGPTIMGIYLFISLNVFRRHHNEAFSGLKIEDYKNFLRFKIEPNGNLTIFPVGVEKVISNWPDTVTGDPIEPKGNVDPASVPFLIEDPVRFCKPFDPTAKPPCDDKAEGAIVQEIIL
jgi:uncharacterized membrane protein (DUF485 family)